MSSRLLFLSLLTFFISFESAVAAPICRHIFNLNEAALALVSDDPYQQWVTWEQSSNFARFRRSGEPMMIRKSYVKSDSVTVTYFEGVPEKLKHLIQPLTNVAWFNHPYNQIQTLPHSQDKAIAYLKTDETASRSVSFTLDQNIYTIKMGVSHPNGPKDGQSKAKADTKEDIADGINRMEYIEKVHREVGSDPELILAKEIAMVADKATGQGYLLRDISFLNSGNYYLPAFSIPYAGRDIALFNHTSPEHFWKHAYASLLGRAKAKLLLRYGLQMETPNSQNILIELDSNLKPTGRLVFRDISDTVLIDNVAQGLGSVEAILKDFASGSDLSRTIKPYWKNSVWRFDEAGPQSFSADTLKDWGQAHDNAYKAEIERTLDVSLKQFDQVDKNAELDKYMDSEYIFKRIQAYRLRLETKAGFKRPNSGN